MKALLLGVLITGVCAKKEFRYKGALLARRDCGPTHSETTYHVMCKVTRKGISFFGDWFCEDLKAFSKDDNTVRLSGWCGGQASRVPELVKSGMVWEGLGGSLNVSIESELLGCKVYYVGNLEEVK